jgi:hypothetical protein
VLGQTKHFEARMHAVRAEAGICNGQVALAFAWLGGGHCPEPLAVPCATSRGLGVLWLAE